MDLGGFTHLKAGGASRVECARPRPHACADVDASHSDERISRSRRARHKPSASVTHGKPAAAHVHL